ncbi:MAG TPA: hypothetical protein P5084_12715 [Paludibacter sp.]|nr:hypothetical protein [Paludibacter sp.]
MDKRPRLLFCLIMDLAGYVTYAWPFLGEWGDMIWAPLSAYIFYRSFGGKTGAIGSFINLAEELLPFTDFIPTFTLGYIYNRFKNKDIKSGNSTNGNKIEI